MLRETVLYQQDLWCQTHRDDGADCVLGRIILHPQLREKGQNEEQFQMVSAATRKPCDYRWVNEIKAPTDSPRQFPPPSCPLSSPCWGWSPASEEQHSTQSVSRAHSSLLIRRKYKSIKKAIRSILKYNHRRRIHFSDVKATSCRTSCSSLISPCSLWNLLMLRRQQPSYPFSPTARSTTNVTSHSNTVL